jgi:N-acetylglucosamine-6-sulfatase
MKRIYGLFWLVLWCAPLMSQKNIIFIVGDDHRHDFLGFMNRIPGLQTPNLDQMAKEGAHLKNTFCTTALCSPSRASMLTGQFPHTHKVVDNEAREPQGLVYFPKYLQEQGYQTAFLGKWHMGASDEKREGFDYWACMRDQGEYYRTFMNINGVPHTREDSLHVSDWITELTLNWLKQRDKTKPFFVWMSHKAVHADFSPAKRHLGKYRDIPIQYPPSMFLTATDSSKTFGLANIKNYHQQFKYTFNLKDIPEWVRKQRYSWHGVDYMYHGSIDFNEFYRKYCETLMGIDESVGQILDFLKQQQLDENTMVVYVGDNGFSFGEHGLIDKRHAYEESMRIPCLMRCPSLIKSGTSIDAVIQTVDFAPTLLELAGLSRTPAQMEGQSFLAMLKGISTPNWRDRIFYEYYWDHYYPQTPAMHAIRTQRYKYIRYYGVWDINEFYDLAQDPLEVNNLIKSPEHQPIIRQLQQEMWTWLEKSQGMQIPIKRIELKRRDNLHPNTW